VRNNNNKNNNNNSYNTLDSVCILGHPSVSERLNENMNDHQTSGSYHANKTTELGILANILVTDTMGSISSLSEDKMAISVIVPQLLHQKKSFAQKQN